MAANMEALTVKKFPPVSVSPESDTPGGFFFLSSLDHSFPMVIESLYAFPASRDDLFDVLKQSLAKALVLFYPLAGDLTLTSEGYYTVDCSKKSVPFVEAISDCTMDVIGDIRIPDLHRTQKLIFNDLDPNVLFTAQVTKFKCGGFTLGITISHALADGGSELTFVNSWAEIARGGSPPAPFHERSLLQARDPPNPRINYDEFVQIADVSGMESLYDTDENVAAMFTFTSENIAAIKKAALADGNLKSCGTFAAVAAVVWKARNKAMNMNPSQLTKLGIFVEIRSRCKDSLSLPDNYFGNLVTIPCFLTTAGELGDRPISWIVDHIQKTVDMVDAEYVRSKIDHVHVHKPPMLSSVGTLVISSWTRLPFTSCDFGWGSATQFGPGGLGREFSVFFPKLEEEGKLGIEVVLPLPSSALSKFQELVDQELADLKQ